MATNMSDDNKDFEQLATEAQPGIVREFFDFLRYNKKWWLLPMMLVVAMVGVLAMLTGTPVAPFIYTLF
jgi:hypothetical protein